MSCMQLGVHLGNDLVYLLGCERGHDVKRGARRRDVERTRRRVLIVDSLDE